MKIHFLLILLNFFTVIKSIQLLIATITDGKHKKFSTQLNLYKNFEQQTSSFDILFTAKIIYLKNFEILQEILDKYRYLFNNQWVRIQKIIFRLF